MRDKRRYTRSKLNQDIALQDRSLLYKSTGANGILHKFIYIFQNVLKIHATLKNLELNPKTRTKKLLAEKRVTKNGKHHLLKEWKKDSQQHLFYSYKY